jgi:hypothetical protein
LPVAVGVPVSSYRPIILMVIEGIAVLMTPNISENKKRVILKEANLKLVIT